MTLPNLLTPLLAVPLEMINHKKETLLLFIVLLIGLLFLLFWTVLLHKAFRKPTQSKVLEDLEELVLRNQLLTDLAACLSTFIGTAFVIYWYGFLEEEVPAPAAKLMVLGIVLFGSGPYLFSKIFLRMKAQKIKRDQKNNTNSL
jgi:hypothetical protein